MEKLPVLFIREVAAGDSEHARWLWHQPIQELPGLLSGLAPRQIWNNRNLGPIDRAAAQQQIISLLKATLKRRPLSEERRMRAAQFFASNLKTSHRNIRSTYRH